MNLMLSAFLNGAIPGVLIAAVVWAALRLAPRHAWNAASRYLIWWAALLVVVLLPAVYAPLPQAPIPAPQRLQLPSRLTANPPLPPPRPPARAHVSPPPPSAPATRGIDPSLANAPPTTLPPHVSFPIHVPTSRWPSWVLAFWIAASLLRLARLATGWWSLERLRARAFDAPAQLQSLARAACPRVARLAVSEEIAMPMAVGPRRPSILIPARLLAELEARELEQLLLHEAAHLARRDDYALLLQRLIESLLPWHPVVWWIARRLNLEREIACDDRVIASTGLARSYAGCLTRIVELSGGVRSSWVAATAADGSSHLSVRVDLLLDKTRHRGTALLKRRLAVFLSLLALLATLSARTPMLVAIAAPLAARVVPAWPHPRIALAPQPAISSESQDLEGQVVEDASGNPLASAELRFHQPGMRELAADLETDRQGRFRAPGLPPGSYSVDVRKPNFITTTLHLSAPSASRVVRLIRYGVIDGQITDESAHPVAGRTLAPGGRTAGSARVVILVKQPGSEALLHFRDTEPDDDGRYRIFDLPPGQYAVGLWYSGLNQGSGVQLYPDNANPRWFSVAGSEEYTDVNFTLQARPGYAVSGKIDLPKPKTQFQLALGLPEQPALPIAQTLTDADGNFRFEKIPPGAYDLFAAGPVGGYTAFESILDRGEPLFGRLRIQVGGQDVQGLAVPLAQGRSLRVVLRGSGPGIPAGCPATANVTLVSLEPWAMLFRSSAVASFAQVATIGSLAPGRFGVSVAIPGTGCYQVNQPEIDLSNGAENPVGVELASAGSIHGRLKTTNPAAVGVVLLDSQDSDEVQARLAFPDSEGRFSFEGLHPGRYRIAARPAAEPRARWIADVARMTEIDVAGGAPASVELAPQ